MKKTQLHKYFSGELSDREALEVQMLMAEHAEDPAMLSQISNEFESMTADEFIDSEAALNDIKRQLGYRSTGYFAGRVLRKVELFAAILAVPLAIALSFTLRPKPVADWQEFSVPEGATAELTLSDGSLLQLNGGSKVVYPDHFAKDGDRKIFLEGEVLAQIATDPEHPFIIRSGDASVKVLGTKFDFKSYTDADNMELLLMNGKVDFCVSDGKSSQSTALQPGDALQYDKRTGKMTLTRFNKDKFKSFADGRSFHFFNITMNDIAAELSKSFGVQVHVMDSKLADTRFFAFFTNGENIEEILDCMNADHKMRIEHRDGRIFLFSL